VSAPRDARACVSRGLRPGVRGLCSAVGLPVRVGLLACLGMAGVAHAGTLDDAVSSARAAIQDGNDKGAVSALKDLEALAAGSAGVVKQARLGEALLLRGAALHRRGGRNEAKGMDAWRAALVVAPELEWDTGLLGEGDDWSVFLALRGEVASREKLDIGVPEATGVATVHLDGLRVRAGDTAPSGLHLGQITCDDGSVFGEWSDLSPAPDWLALCPGGVDTSVVVAAPDDDDWGDLAPAFGAPEPAADPVAEPAAEPVAAVEPAPAGEPAPAPDPEPAAPAPKPARTGGGFGTPQVALMGAGGALVAGGTVLYFAMVVPSVDAAVGAAEDPSGVTRTDADALTAKARLSQGLTLGALGGGIALAAGGLTWGLLLDAPVQPVIGVRHIGLRGSF
jgi:hypothetical protein